VTTPPLKPTRSFAEVLARIKARLPEEPALPKPATDSVPPPSFHDTDKEPTQ
jgi:hypothetical protein